MSFLHCLLLSFSLFDSGQFFNFDIVSIWEKEIHFALLCELFAVILLREKFSN